MNYTFRPLRFLAWFVGLSVGLPLILAAIDRLVGVDLYNSGIALIPVFLAAMQEGVAFAKAEKRAPSSSEAWGVARTILPWLAVASLVLAILAVIVEPDILRLFSVMGGNAWVIFGAILFIFFAIGFVASWGFFRLGARSHLQAEEKKRAKNKR